MIYAIDVIGNCPFGWNAELFDSADRAYDFKARLDNQLKNQNFSSFSFAKDDEPELTYDEWFKESGYKFRYVVVEFTSLDEATTFYGGCVYNNFGDK